MTRSGDAGVTGGCRREGAGGPSEGGARAVHGGVTPRRWHSAATALMRWDVTSAPSNHRLGGRPPQPCAPSLICPPRLRGDTKPSLPMCEGHTQAPHAVQGGGCAPPPPRAPCALPGILHPGVVLLAVGGAGLGCGGSGYCCVGGCGGHPGLCKLPGGGSNTPSMAEHPRDVPEGGTPILARLTGLTSCPLQHPQGAVLEGCDPRGKAAWGPRAVFRGGACVPGPPLPLPPVLRGTPCEPGAIQAGGDPGTAVPPAWMLSGPLQGDTKGLSHPAVPACPC